MLEEKKKLLILVNVDWFLISHRLPLVLAAQKDGYEVHIACSFTNDYNRLTSLGFHLHELPISRAGLSVFSEIKIFIKILLLIKNIKPNQMHFISIKPIIYGGIASRLLGLKEFISSISGLGYIFTAKTKVSILLKPIILFLYRLSLKNSDSLVIFQNSFDRDYFVKQKIVLLENSLLIPGSGVDLEKFVYTPEPQGEIIIMMVSRLLIDKGVYDFIEAASILKKESSSIKMVLVGGVDENPQSIKQYELDNWISEGLIDYWGFRDDIAEVMSKANVIVLPSYREGLPKCLIEAAACSRATITTDVPGCRDAILPKKTGLLINVKDPQSLVRAIKTLESNQDLRVSMGREGRKLAENSFDINEVIRIHLNVYNNHSTNIKS